MASNGEVSVPLSPSITAIKLNSAVDGFSNGIDNVTVTGGSGSFTVTFGGTQSTTSIQWIFCDTANASNGSTLRTIAFFLVIDRQDRNGRGSAGRLRSRF
jgi:hypothetical protein